MHVDSIINADYECWFRAGLGLQVCRLWLGYGLGLEGLDYIMVIKYWKTLCLQWWWCVVTVECVQILNRKQCVKVACRWTRSFCRAFNWNVFLCTLHSHGSSPDADNGVQEICKLMDRIQSIMDVSTTSMRWTRSRVGVPIEKSPNISINQEINLFRYTQKAYSLQNHNSKSIHIMCNWRRYCCLTSFFWLLIRALVAKI